MTNILNELVTANEVKKNTITTNSPINFKMLVKFNLFLTIFNFGILGCIGGANGFVLLAVQLGLGLAFLNLQNEF